MRNYYLSVFVVLFLAAIIMSACTGKNNYPENVNNALNAAGDNSGELIKVIEHFSQTEDSLKREAACFLIGNMDEHCFSTYRLFDTAGVTVEFDPLSYENYEILTKAVDSIELERGELDYESQDKVYDVETINANYLINQIDLAFTAWQEKPWAKSLTFDEFCRYVLPYRGSNEPLEDWRSYFMNKYSDIDTMLSDPADPIMAATYIGDDIPEWFGFDPRYYFHPTDQGLNEMLQSGLGRCEDITNITIYAFRANGLAITSDYTPHWATTGNNHAWNSILIASGKVVPFMGSETGSNTDSYKLHNKAAKVYRKTYDHQMDNLIYRENKQDSLPRWLAGKNYLDVSADYMDVCDIEITATEEIPDSIDFVYICVFNSGEFRPIHWAIIEDNKAVFSDMGQDIAYLAASYQNKEIVQIAAPFILYGDGAIEYLTINHERQTGVTIEGIPNNSYASPGDSVKLIPLELGQTYKLSYWDNGWQTFKELTAETKIISVDGLPAGGLYWLTSDIGGSEERVFTIEDSKAIFW